jgi:hypothetical protein
MWLCMTHSLLFMNDDVRCLTYDDKCMICSLWCISYYTYYRFFVVWRTIYPVCCMLCNVWCTMYVVWYKM